MAVDVRACKIDYSHPRYTCPFEPDRLGHPWHDPTLARHGHGTARGQTCSVQFGTAIVPCLEVL